MPGQPNSVRELMGDTFHLCGDHTTIVSARNASSAPFPSLPVIARPIAIISSTLCRFLPRPAPQNVGRKHLLSLPTWVRAECRRVSR